MFLLGHLGIGFRLARPLGKGLSARWILGGTLLPDLIDKPLYYGPMLATGKRGAELGFLCGTRTVGHTAILLLALTGAAALRRSKPLAALALGMATHLLLDNVGDRLVHPGDVSSAFQALAFPLRGAHFIPIPFAGPAEHLGAMIQPFTLASEALGSLFLSWDFWLARRWDRRRETRRQRRVPLA